MGPIYGSKELFDHLTMGKQMTNVFLKLLAIHDNTRNHLTVCKQMSTVEQNN